MCLERLQDFKFNLDENGVGFGWKVFNVNPKTGSLNAEYRKAKVRPRGRWLKEKDYRFAHEKDKKFLFDSKISYPYGFHVFLKGTDAEGWRRDYHYDHKAIRVKFRKIVAKGLQNGGNVIVAKEIFIPKEQ